MHKCKSMIGNDTIRFLCLVVLYHFTFNPNIECSSCPSTTQRFRFVYEEESKSDNISHDKLILKNVKTQHECELNCVRRIDCSSYNFMTRHFICEIIFNQVKSPVRKQGWLFAKKEMIEDDFITTEPPSLSTATSDEHVIPIPPVYEDHECDKDGVFRNGSDCRGFILCSYKKATPQFCPKGTYFNHHTSLCEEKGHVPCLEIQGVTCYGSNRTLFHEEISWKRQGKLRQVTIQHFRERIICSNPASQLGYWGCAIPAPVFVTNRHGFPLFDGESAKYYGDVLTWNNFKQDVIIEMKEKLFIKQKEFSTGVGTHCVRVWASILDNFGIASNSCVSN